MTAGLRQPPAGDFAGESARHDVVAFEVDADHGGLVRGEGPELGAARGVPEPQQAVGVAGHDHAGHERRVGEEPRTALEGLEEPSGRPVPEPGRPVGSCREHAVPGYPARREHLADMAFEPRDDAGRIEIDEQRRPHLPVVAREGDEASGGGLKRHDAHGNLEIGEDRAVRGEGAEVAFRVGHEDASVRQERRGGDAARGLQRELGAVFAHDVHRTVERAAHQRAAGVGERNRADRGAVLEGAEQATFGKP